MKKSLVRALPLFLLPVVASAQAFDNLESALESIAGLINTLLPLLIGLAMVAFFWGLVRFVFSAGDEEAREKGKKFMIWGIIGVFVMVAFWGIINFLLDTLGFDPSGADAPPAPDIPEF